MDQLVLYSLRADHPRPDSDFVPLVSTADVSSTGVTRVFIFVRDASCTNANDAAGANIGVDAAVFGPHDASPGHGWLQTNHVANVRRGTSIGVHCKPILFGEVCFTDVGITFQPSTCATAPCKRRTLDKREINPEAALDFRIDRTGTVVPVDCGHLHGCVW